jgi:hypothetical protein
MQYNTRGFPKGPAHGGGSEMYWDYVSRDEKRAHHDKVKARRRQSVRQRVCRRK